MTPDGIILQAATAADVSSIRRLAHEIWWPTYGGFIAHGQISLMLELIYSEQALQAQIEAGQRFVLALRGQRAVGFVSFRPKPAEPDIMRIEKLYLSQSQQGKGTGRLLIDHVNQQAQVADCSLLELNVNRHNPAVGFYDRQGFVITDTVDIPYHGYVLNDYVMQRRVISQL